LLPWLAECQDHSKSSQAFHAEHAGQQMLANSALLLLLSPPEPMMHNCELLLAVAAPAV